MASSDKASTNHRFLDEAGDTTFYGKGKVPIIGSNGVSNCFILGMVKFREPLADVRTRILEARNEIVTSNYFKGVPSVLKRMDGGGFYFHATDDLPEVRKEFFDVILGFDCSFEAVVGRKAVSLYEKKHNGNESEFYADLLSHLLKNKFSGDEKLVLTIAQRGKTTRNSVLEMAKQKAEARFAATRPEKATSTNIEFNVQNHRTEPLLDAADYFCWTIQRIYERGETRFYDYLFDKISLVIDLYDSEKYKGNKNYYKKGNPLTAENKMSP
ncbi:MAG: DUF3800 domain-containing protein [Pyrinomonadaceae bacterium]